MIVSGVSGRDVARGYGHEQVHSARHCAALSGGTERPAQPNPIMLYGRQIGRIGDALEVPMRHLDREKLTNEERDVLALLEGQLAQVREVKARERLARK